VKPAHALAYAPLVNLLSKVPSFRYHHLVHSPLSLRTSFGNVLSTHVTRSALAVSHDRDGLLQDEASSLLHLETGKGLLRFQSSPPVPAVATQAHLHRNREQQDLPRNTTPFKEFPLFVAEPHHKLMPEDINPSLRNHALL